MGKATSHILPPPRAPTANYVADQVALCSVVDSLNTSAADAERSLEHLYDTTGSLAHIVIENRDHIEYARYCALHGIPADFTVAHEVKEFFWLLVSCTWDIIFLRVPGMIKEFIYIAIAAAVALVTVRYVVYGTMHSVVDPALTDTQKLINSILNAIVGWAGSALNGVSSVLNTVIHVVDPFSRKSTIPKLSVGNNPFSWGRDKWGAYYSDIVNMKSLCGSRYTQKFQTIHLGLQLITGSNICQFVRFLYPSPMLQWIGFLLYGSAFSDPERGNCVVHPETIVCFAWISPDFIWAIFFYSVVFEIISGYWPLIQFLLMTLRCIVYVAEYTAFHRSTQHWDTAFQFHADRNIRHVTSSEHARRHLARKLAANHTLPPPKS
jgi:hypothetical protein